MIRAAGILILNKDGQALFLKRGAGSDYPNFFCFPGGRLEGDETPIQAAIRETFEETGHKFDAKDLNEWTVRVAPQEASQLVTPPLGEEVEFTTFVTRGVEMFVPDLSSGEHTGFGWFPIDQPPEPLHPGCRIALRRFTMNDELQVAEAIRDGELVSPQLYGNVWLFALRISGTGYAFRDAKKDDAGKVIREAEVAYRRPENYLTPEFLARCNGLFVIMMHPDEGILDSAEFGKRIVGSILLPYIKPDPTGGDHGEVWGIAKIMDEPAAKMLRTMELSTSPGVILGSESETFTRDDGTKVLIEDKPRLLDHLAICRQGVWDKGGEPAGVETTFRGDAVMKLKRLEGESDDAYKARVDEATALARNDDTGVTLDKMLKGIDAKLDSMSGKVEEFGKRMDAMEKTKADADETEEEKKKKEEEEKKADAKKRADAMAFSGRNDAEGEEDLKKRWDAEEKAMCDAMEEAGEAKEVAADKAKKRRADAEEEDKKKMDKKRADAASGKHGDDINAMRKEIEKLQGMIPKQLTDKDYADFAGHQARYDAVYSLFGQSAGRPLHGEDINAYRLRMARGLQAHSEAYKGSDLGVIAIDSVGFSNAEARIMADASAAARSPVNIPAGTLREIHSKTISGQPRTDFMGQPISWMQDFMPTAQAVKRVNTNATRH